MGIVQNLRKWIRGFIFPTQDVLSLFESQPKLKVLDVGAGTGFLGELFLNNQIAKKVVGTEKNKKYFQHSKDGLTISSPDQIDGLFDLIVFNDVLHHVPEKKEFFEFHLQKFSKPGSLVLIKEMSTKSKLCMYWNRFHDLVFANESISELPETEAENMLSSMQIIKRGRRRIFLYDHYYYLAQI